MGKIKILSYIIKISVFGFFILFLLGCGNYKKIADFTEASGLCYMQDLDSFFIVGDEGEIQQIDSSGKKIEYFKFKKKYDLESIVCDNKNNSLLTIDEETGNILKMQFLAESVIPLNFKITEIYIISGYNLDEQGIEGFTQMSDNKYVVSTQTEKENLLILDFSNNKFSITKKINFKYTDLSGLDYYNGELYILSDKNDHIYKYDLETESIIEKIALKKGDWEGISINRNTGEIFLANDEGRVVKYK